MRHAKWVMAFVFSLGIGWTDTLLAQSQVQLEVRLVRADFRSGGDQPVTDMKVWLLPSSGTPLVKSPDNSGIVRFTFPETAFVTVRVGSPPSGIRLQQMSGRFNQSTSAYFSGHQAGGALESIEEFLFELRGSARGIELSDAIKEEVRDIQRDLRRWDPAKGDNANTLDNIKKLSETLLRKPWKLGIDCTYDRNGAKITSVVGGSPAVGAGIGIGDRIVEVNDVRVGTGSRDLKTLPEVFSESDTGRVVVKVEQKSGKEPRTLEIQLKR